MGEQIHFREISMRAIVLLALLLSLTANAAPVSYQLNGIGSGTVDGVAFTNAVFSVTAATDTDSSWVFDLATSIGPDDVALTTTVEIAGIGAAQLTGLNSVVLFDQEHKGIFSFGHGAQALSSTLLTVESTGLGGWSMLTSLGPVTGVPGGAYPDVLPFPLYDPVSSSLGDIQFSTDLHNLIFTVQVVPVPAAVWLFISALTGLGLLRRRRFNRL